MLANHKCRRSYWRLRTTAQTRARVHLQTMTDTYLASGQHTANAEDIQNSVQWAVAHQILKARRTTDLLPFLFAYKTLAQTRRTQAHCNTTEGGGSDTKWLPAVAGV